MSATAHTVATRRDNAQTSVGPGIDTLVHKAHGTIGAKTGATDDLVPAHLRFSPA